MQGQLTSEFSAAVVALGIAEADIVKAECQRSQASSGVAAAKSMQGK
jgi:hypothetical protein